jgi:hypothetical protein
VTGTCRVTLRECRPNAAKGVLGSIYAVIHTIMAWPGPSLSYVFSSSSIFSPELVGYLAKKDTRSRLTSPAELSASVTIQAHDINHISRAADV